MGGQNRSLYQQMSDQWQQSYNNYLNGLDRVELPAGLHYNENGEAVMPPDEVIKRGYTFLTDNTGKVKLLDKDNKIIFNDVKNQPNLHDWIDKNKLWNKPKSLSEASQVASIRNPEGMKTIRDAFQWGGNWAGGTIAAPVLAVGVSEFAPYLYSKTPQVVDKAIRFMNPGSVGEMALGKDAATQAIRTGISAAEKYPWLMANTWQGATANGLWVAGGSAAALNEAGRAFSGESADSKATAALNAGLAIPFMPIRGVENAEALLKMPFLRNKQGNLNQFGLFLNRGPWKQSKTLWRQFHKKGGSPYNYSDIQQWEDKHLKDVEDDRHLILSDFNNKNKELKKQLSAINKNFQLVQDQIAALRPRVTGYNGDGSAKLDNFVYNYYVINPDHRSFSPISGVSTFLRIPENSPKYQTLKYNTIKSEYNIPVQTPSTPEQIANFRIYRQAINDLLKEDGLVAGSTVGYSRGYIQGGMNNDTEIITTRSRLADAQKKMKFTKVGENSIGGVNGTSPLAQGKTNTVEYDIIDEDASGNATGTLAHQIFQALHPEEARQFYKANIDNDTDSYTLSLPIKAEQLLQELRQEGNMEKVQMLDMFGAGINVARGENFKKQASRAYNVLLNPEFIPSVRSTLNLMLHKQFGPKAEQFSSKISDFTNIEDNKRFLNEIINASELKYFSPEQVEEIAKNPEQMRNIFDYYNMNNFIGSRGMQRLSPLTGKDMTPSELREGFSSNIQFGGGSGSGVGLNMTSGAFKAGSSYGTINGTRLLKTTYDPNPQSIPDWITQYGRITDRNNFPTTLYNEVGIPNEAARIETESRKLNLPVWRNTATDRQIGAYNGSYAGPLYYETNPDNIFILHGVFPENGGLFTPKFRSFFGDYLSTVNTSDNFGSFESTHPFEYLRSKGYEIRNHTTPEDRELNSIARRYPLNKVWNHLQNRYNDIYDRRNSIIYQIDKNKLETREAMERLNTTKSKIQNAAQVRGRHVFRFTDLNDRYRPTKSDITFQLAKYGLFSTLGGITAASPFIIHNVNKKQESEYNMSQSAKQYGQVINDLNPDTHAQSSKNKQINVSELSPNDFELYKLINTYNLPIKLFNDEDLRYKLSETYDAYRTQNGIDQQRALDYMNQLIKYYGYKLVEENGDLRAIKL